MTSSGPSATLSILAEPFLGALSKPGNDKFAMEGGLSNSAESHPPSAPTPIFNSSSSIIGWVLEVSGKSGLSAHTKNLARSSFSTGKDSAGERFRFNTLEDVHNLASISAVRSGVTTHLAQSMALGLRGGENRSSSSGRSLNPLSYQRQLSGSNNGFSDKPTEVAARESTRQSSSCKLQLIESLAVTETIRKWSYPGCLVRLRARKHCNPKFAISKFLAASQPPPDGRVLITKEPATSGFHLFREEALRRDGSGLHLEDVHDLAVILAARAGITTHLVQLMELSLREGRPEEVLDAWKKFEGLILPQPSGSNGEVQNQVEVTARRQVSRPVLQAYAAQQDYQSAITSVLRRRCYLPSKITDNTKTATSPADRFLQVVGVVIKIIRNGATRDVLEGFTRGNDRKFAIHFYETLLAVGQSPDNPWVLIAKERPTDADETDWSTGPPLFHMGEPAFVMFVAESSRCNPVDLAQQVTNDMSHGGFTVPDLIMNLLLDGYAKSRDFAAVGRIYA
ncbi:hypothetical protein M407DRAFT_215868 [Tulasnella calospora MUT 4182]|uniref:Uncharacterized protein n=1 Tax=Tulasnella calospora MUT 4182 TaxID=1051891 RepID=A0A0C3Q2Q4_9AGAM|nr:hypothetical protein M407DRAFT_215868 [Tulasnella calospora MUT 4182]